MFADGSVIMLNTPGHTPGHHSLLVKLPQMGNIIISVMPCISARISRTIAYHGSISIARNAGIDRAAEGNRGESQGHAKDSA